MSEIVPVTREALANAPVILPPLPEQDPEIAAMEAVRAALDALGPLPDTGATERILRWACDRWNVPLDGEAS